MDLLLEFCFSKISPTQLIKMTCALECGIIRISITYGLCVLRQQTAYYKLGSIVITYIIHNRLELHTAAIYLYCLLNLQDIGFCYKYS